MIIQNSQPTLVFPILDPEEQAGSLEPLLKFAQNAGARIQLIYRVSYLSYFNPKSYTREACLASCLGTVSTPWIAELYYRDHVDDRKSQLQGWVQAASHAGVSTELTCANESSIEFKNRLANLERETAHHSLVVDDYFMGNFLRRQLLKHIGASFTLINRQTEVSFPETRNTWAAA